MNNTRTKIHLSNQRAVFTSMVYSELRAKIMVSSRMEGSGFIQVPDALSKEEYVSINIQHILLFHTYKTKEYDT